MASIEEEHECSKALFYIKLNLATGFVDSIIHRVIICIVVALDLVCADTILLNTLLKFVSPLSGTRHIRIH